MNSINIENYEIANNAIVITRRAIVKFICMMYIIYICIYALNYKKINACFNKKVEKELKNLLNVEEEVLSLIRPEDASEVLVNEVLVNEVEVNEVEVNLPVASTNEIVAPVVNLENDATVWYTFADKKGRYKGDWKNGLPNGKGIHHIFKDDSYIYGNFVDGNAEGFCKQTFEQTWEKTQPYYEGEFNRNQFHGKGEYHYGDGDYYKGMWKNNKYHGQGAAYSKRLDKTWVGEYENDEKGEGNWVKGEI